MTTRRNITCGLSARRIFLLVILGLLCLTLSGDAAAQSIPYAHTYAKSKTEVDQALKEMQAYAGQKLPIVDGFVATGDTPLNRYERAFYQFSIDLVPDSAGSTIVRVAAKITAWYADRDPSKSGYQVLPSNGRLELDLLDRLDERFGVKPASGTSAKTQSSVQLPKPKLDLSGVPGNPLPSGKALPSGSGSSSLSGDEITALRIKREAEDRRMQQLNTELQSLEQIQRNQVHPRNLVVVKKSGAPVLARAAEGSHTLFTAAADDEFEFLDAEGEWIHVQISGESRGYIRKSNLELPEAITARLQASAAAAQKEQVQVFRLAREETSTFPGDWAELRGKSVRIYTVQPLSQDPREIGARAKLSFAASLFEKSPAELASSSPAVEGIVIIFDSADGGILGATLASVQQLTSHAVTLEKFWGQCYMDPPEAFQGSAKPQ